jgi:hypothetical protein
MDGILTLRELDFRNLFINCTHIYINKEKGEPSIPSVQDITTDDFDWEENFRKAYGND